MPNEPQGSTAGIQQQFDQAFQQFESAARGAGLMPASAPSAPSTSAATPGFAGEAAGASAAEAAFNPCQQWKNARGTVMQVIAALRAVGGLFPVAKRAADVIQTLATLLDQLCP